MRMLVQWMLLIGFLTGLQTRVLGADPCKVLASMHETGHPGQCHEDHVPCDPAHDEKCPAEHHHHHNACGHALPMSAELEMVCRLGMPASSLLTVLPESEPIPDGPYLSSDRPPLI